jgi:hypothetical protein
VIAVTTVLSPTTITLTLPIGCPKTEYIDDVYNYSIPTAIQVSPTCLYLDITKDIAEPNNISVISENIRITIAKGNSYERKSRIHCLPPNTRKFFERIIVTCDTRDCIYSYIRLGKAIKICNGHSAARS